AAAGNSGPAGRVSTPGSADAALTVGAVDKQGRMADFSSPGPRVSDHAIKPDVTAPGVDIMAAAVGGGYRSLSGTSMAAPHVTGAAAILAQRHPEWTGAQLKAALTGSAAPAQEATLYQQGAGLIDLQRALKQQVSTLQGNLWTTFPWNGSGRRTATRTITYANAGDEPVTLDLSAQGEVLKLPDDRVTVPAKGRASVTLTIDAGGKAPGDYPGTVTATSGETVIRTLAGAYVEPESYDVTITVLNRQGIPITPWLSEIYDAKSGSVHFPAFRNGVARVRLPKGEWNLYTDISEKLDAKPITTLAVSPLTIDGGDQRLTVDARQAKAARVTLDDPSAMLKPGYNVRLVHGAWNISPGSGRGDVNSQFFVIPARVPGLTYSLGTRWLSKDVSPSPYVYDLVDHRTDGLPEDPAHDARQKDLAKVTATYRASGVAAMGTPAGGVRHSSLGGFMLPLVGDISLPGTLVHYRTPGLTYDSGIEIGTALIIDGGRLMKRGHTREVWNAAVTGPSLLLPGGSRTGDKLTFSGVGLFADGDRGRTGSDLAATGTVTLAKDGQELARADLVDCVFYEPERCGLVADLPPESGAYTLTASMRRQVPHTALSTAVESVWTFRSATTAGERPLPLMAVRYRPAGLDDSNRAAPGTTTRLPLWIERNLGSTEARAASVRLEMSTDDGASWHRVPVRRNGSGWTAELPNPRTEGFVSLRATVTDTAGAGLTQTVIRAYAVG
ncbi:S8 family serine peptidase, partial [Nonomuraea sp. SYSU D8015]|uniref:S8 family serine peptidase n=1 Tax=Nonomuraea sp. SYSU D8015 TaxID=2593644 RepID=UPI00166073FE